MCEECGCECDCDRKPPISSEVRIRFGAWTVDYPPGDTVENYLKAMGEYLEMPTDYIVFNHNEAITLDYVGQSGDQIEIGLIK